MPHATVELLRGNDSVLVKAGITDSLGLAIFEQVNNGVYLLRVSIVNYQRTIVILFQLPLAESSGQIPAIVLEPAAASLQGVTVLCQKTFYTTIAG